MVLKSYLNNCWVITKYTFLEIIKSKVMVQVLILSLALVIMIYVATEFTFGTPEKVALDFGLGSLSLSSTAMAIFLGVGLLSKEIESRTIYMILCRPISRSAFVIGKVLGMVAVLVLNILILGVVTLGFCKILGGNIAPLVYWVLLFSIFEAVIMLLVVIIFSLFTNNILSVIFTLSIFIIGHAIGETKTLIFTEKNPIVNFLIKTFEYIIPNLSKINFKDYVVYNQTLPLNVLEGATLYAMTYFLFLMAIICVVFQNKNLD